MTEAGAKVVILDEFNSALSNFISLSTLDYQSVRWRLFNSPNSSEWSNILTLATLLFTLPASNGKLQRSFSQLNIIKTNKRASLGNETLNDLLTLNSWKGPLENFSAIKLWWEAKQRRPNQSQRKDYKKTK